MTNSMKITISTVIQLSINKMATIDFVCFFCHFVDTKLMFGDGLVKSDIFFRLPGHQFYLMDVWWVD